MEQFKNCPVMAFIHGGKNLFLSPVQIPPDIPTHNWAGGRNVIFGTIGYRLGIWGFFNLHPHGKGKFYDANAGLWGK
ncbi:hypothetical protein WR25_23592 [Diploscapter pachys]|uniref:Carboxylesterase type B domain-containing protein n=1 Tax=Diploscapter pachys TaxID=2018661 RepID=A0A2A2L2L5_9BILA|nr:hypothetical protein WR25_23592 [Diploscapter pachys]